MPLTPEDLAAIKEIVAPGSAPPDAGSGDKNGEIAEALSILAEAVMELKRRLEAIEGELGTFTGGLSDLVDRRKRLDYMTKFRGDHPEFGRFEQIVRDLAGKDVFEEAGGELYDYELSPDRTDEGVTGKVKELLDSLEGRFGRLIDALSAAAKKDEKPAGETPPRRSGPGE